MVIDYGTRLYGRVSECGTTKIATKLAHRYFVPLFSAGSSLILEEHGNGTYTAVPLGLHLESTVAGYARTWGVVALVASLVRFFSARADAARAATWGVPASPMLLVAPALVALATAAVVAFATLRLGKLSLEQAVDLK